jgi:enoyl-CoA hydratase/carnithine racemase
MKDKEFAEVYKEDFLSHWTQMTKFRKPIVAAVSGYAVSTRLTICSRRENEERGTDDSFSGGKLGGGCELAMM